ncbi:hypothetical protein PG990_001932 [Apiospora arundinis]|uniref:Uncharacterized protein n=1 Tax=Apiospora arundinis TaxID=335852 RepID=A0ABR2I3Y0_9PEZI
MRNDGQPTSLLHHLPALTSSRASTSSLCSRTRRIVRSARRLPSWRRRTAPLGPKIVDKLDGGGGGTPSFHELWSAPLFFTHGVSDDWIYKIRTFTRHGTGRVEPDLASSR